MDIDGDVDGRLAQQFGCMGTVDHEILVNQFQQILGPFVNLSAESCRFFLDMNNWYLFYVMFFLITRKDVKLNFALLFVFTGTFKQP